MYYFDTSFLAPLFLQEPTSIKVERFMTRLPAGKLFAVPASAGIRIVG